MSSNIQFILKRLIDMLLSSIGLILLTGPFAIIALAIKLDSKGPVFFRQERVGKNGKAFRTWKFRTMVEGAERSGAGYGFEAKDQRITTVGRFLRSTGLDELPQFVDVLKGDMSLVGPRPTLPYQVEMYNEHQRLRLTIRPGITGWALIHGRNELKWSQRIEYDVWYIEHFSLWLDFVILLRTLKVVALREGLRMDQKVEEVEDLNRGGM